jgi:hypothetical protein
MATWKQIESRRELRLWITQVLAPVTMMGLAAWSIPEVRDNIKDKFNKAKEFIKSKIHK